MMGMGHGAYSFTTGGQDVFEYSQESARTAYTEFGVGGPAPPEVIANLIPEEERWPAKAEGAWRERRALGEGEDVNGAWLPLATIGELFGEPGSLQEMLEGGYVLQREGLKALFEEYRRQKPVCSMALSWVFNEPIPTAANTSVLSWPAIPKAGYQGMKEALRAVMASARIPRFVWKAGQEFTLEPWILNDLYGTIPAGRLEVRLEVSDQTIDLGSWEFSEVSPNEHLRGPVMKCRLPQAEARMMIVRLAVEGRGWMDSAYTLRYRRANRETQES
jgi:beta-mannosidase